VNGKWERAFLLGEGCCIAQREDSHLAREVLDTQTAREKARSTFLSNASRRRTLKGNGSSCLRSPAQSYTIYHAIT
jgi:hypothetical protein